MSLITCEGLTKKYGSTRAVDNLDVTIEAGPPVALIGPNGAGKTTLLSLLSGFIRPSDGRALVLGKQPGSSALHGKLSALPQDANLDSRLGIGRQLVHYARLQGFSRSDAKRAMAESLSTVQLTDAMRKNPEELSHGMRKRLSIAQMLMGSPKVALLDEPTAGLDPPNVKIIRDVIAAHAGKTTFIISSHNLDELEKLCDDVIFLQEGRLVKHQAISSLSDQQGVLTVRLEDSGVEEFAAACAEMPGCLNVTRQQQGAFIIEYDAQKHPAFDIRMIEMLNARGWGYRNVSKGRSLEDKLFDS